MASLVLSLPRQEIKCNVTRRAQRLDSPRTSRAIMFGPKPHAGTQNARKGLGMRLVNDLLKMVTEPNQ